MKSEQEIARELAEKYGLAKIQTDTVKFIDTRTSELKKIALGLLKRYEKAENIIIMSLPGDTKREMQELKFTVEKFEQMIEELTK